MTCPHDPLNFLRLARELGTRSSDETCLRTAVGRAYYALFLFAWDQLGFPESKKKEHKRVIKELKRRHGYQATAGQLQDLLRLRHTADYQMLPKDPSERDWGRNWTRASILAEHILSKLRNP